MNLARPRLLVSTGAALAAAGLAIVLAFSRSAAPSPVPLAAEPVLLRGTQDEPELRASRLAFVPPGAFEHLLIPPWSSFVEAPETAVEVPWSLEINPERRSLPPVVVAPPRLPWLTPRPRERQRFYTLKTRLAEIAPTATARLAEKFAAAKMPLPPSEIALVAIKDEKMLELHAREKGGTWKLIHRYRILAASGGQGPKLQRGDRQVPEGIYAISFLNPNSAYHVSMRVNFPNAFDRAMAAKDARRDLGGDIMIHGKNLSAGCLAMGDEAVEELFVLAAQTGLGNIRLIIAPTDMREHGIPAAEPGRPEWLPKLYAEIASAMGEFKKPPAPSLLSFFAK